jgi:phosphatidylserine decarboxylase
MRLDPAGWPFVASLAGLTGVTAWLAPALAAIPAVLLLFTLNFFRDPERRAPAERSGLVSPADGKIIRADVDRVSIFMNVFDVHVCRSPIGGRIADVRHVRGRFLAAMRDDASEHNERTAIVVQPDSGPPVRFVLVAGLIARRIVCRTAPGAEVGAGARVGIIRFGSRVDVDLPPGASPAVAIGQRVVAGETIVARLAP